jgi:cytoskeleton protein RodZ
MTEPAAGAETAGSLLRAAREAQGLHIAALAAAIKVAPRKLDALENDRFSELPDATFTRALALTVCRSLKIDPKPVLDLLPAVQPSKLESVGEHLNTPFRERGQHAAGGLMGAAVKPLVWAGALLLLAALLMFFVPARWLPTSLDEAAELAASAPFFPASEATATAPPAPALVAASAAESTFAAPAASAASGGEAAAVAASASAVVSTPEPAVVPADTLDVQVNAESWVEVRDANGRVLLSRLVATGEQLSLQGPLPLRLVVGNALGVQLRFRQQPVDLVPATRDNVARLQLPPP